MSPDDRAKTIMHLIAAVAIGGAILFGVLERLEDPLSTSVVAAEDPYTHMILVRGHIHDGTLDSVFPGGTLYPPGMHAILAATWVYTGLDLYDIFRVGPAIFGAIGILGISVLVARHAGPLAGAVTALAAALAPELIFRTTMMAPTAVDIAVLPFIFIAGAETLSGRRWWGIVAGALMMFLVISHPWMLAIFGPLMLAWVFTAIPAVWWGRAKVRVDPIGVLIMLGVVGANLIAAVTICWDECGLGFQDVVFTRMEAALDRISLGIGILCVIGAALAFAFRKAIIRVQDGLIKLAAPTNIRVALAICLAATLLLLTIPATQNGMPEFVDLPRMYGWGILGLAALAFACMPFIRDRAVLPVAGLAIITYPFVIYNPLDSPYWPHRTAAYLGIALVALTGIGAALVVRGAKHLAVTISQRAEHRNRRGAHTQGIRSKVYSVGALVSVLGATVMAGTVYAATPLEYEDGWYRLYPECEFNELRSIAEDARPGTVIVAGSWQAKLVVGAFADDGMNVWYSYEMLTREDRREKTLNGLELEGRDLIIVEDRYLRTEQPTFDRTFLQEAPFEPLGSWCDGGLAHPRLTAHIARAVPA